MIVKENIVNFKRGESPKNSLGLGLKPVIFGEKADWDASIMEEFEDELDYLYGSGLFPVYLLPKNITPMEVIKLLGGSENSKLGNIEEPDVWNKALGGYSQDAMGQPSFTIVMIETEKWGDYKLDDLMVIDHDAEEIPVNDETPSGFKNFS